MKYWKVRNVAGARLVAAETIGEALAAARMVDITGAELVQGRLPRAASLLVAWQAQDEPETLDFVDAAALLDSTENYARRALYTLHQAGEVHVADWLPPVAGGQHRPVYALGAGIDAPRPAMSAAQLLEYKRRHGAARRERLRLAAAAETPQVRAQVSAAACIALNWKAPTK